MSQSTANSRVAGGSDQRQAGEKNNNNHHVEGHKHKQRASNVTMMSFETAILFLILHLFLTNADTIDPSALRGARTLQEANGIRTKYEKRIPASSFVEKKGAILSDSANGLFWLNTGDWIKYQLDLPEAGVYLLQARISSPLGEGTFLVVNPDTGDVYASLDIMTPTKTWDEYATVEADLILPKGSVPLTLQVLSEGWSLLWLSLREIDNVDATSISDPVPILDASPSTVPVVDITRNAARDKDLVQPYRTMIASSTYSEMEGMLVEESTEGLKNLYWIDRGDYVTYNLQLPVGGGFLFKARISSPDGVGAFQVRNKVSGEIYASVTDLPSTGSFQTWETLITPVELPAGDLALEIRALSQGWNLLWIVLELEVEQSPLIDITSPVVFINNGN